VLSTTYANATFNDKNVGTNKPVSVTGISISGTDAGNYALQSTSASATASISEKILTGSFTAADKIYDGNTSATITGRALSGVVAGDGVSLTGGTATFDTKEVGTNKTVTGVGFALGGAGKDNYSLASTTLTTAASITAWTALGTGFYQPVGVPNSVFTPKGTTANPPAATGSTIWNVIKGGQTVPL
jgi:hypothetical protein